MKSDLSIWIKQPKTIVNVLHLWFKKNMTEEIEKIIQKNLKKKAILDKYANTGGSLEKVLEFVEKNKQSEKLRLKKYLKSKGVHPYIINKALSKVFNAV